MKERKSWKPTAVWPPTNMILFVVLNTASLQLLPHHHRPACGRTRAPACPLHPARRVDASLASVLSGILMAKLLGGLGRAGLPAAGGREAAGA